MADPKEHRTSKHRSGSKDDKDEDGTPKKSKSHREDSSRPKSRSGKHADQDTSGQESGAGEDRPHKSSKHSKDKDKDKKSSSSRRESSRKATPVAEAAGDASRLYSAQTTPAPARGDEVPPGGCPFDWGDADSDLSTSFSEYDKCSRSLSVGDLDSAASYHHHRELDPGDAATLPPAAVKGEFKATFSKVEGRLPPQSRLVIRRFKREKPHKKEKPVRVRTGESASITYKKAKKSTVVEVTLQTAGTPFAGTTKRLRDLDLSSGQKQTWTLEPLVGPADLGAFVGPWSVGVSYSYVAQA